MACEATSISWLHRIDSLRPATEDRAFAGQYGHKTPQQSQEDQVSGKCNLVFRPVTMSTR
ncbi:hypothetical protein ColTof4_11547 [Colletotrichum tofieldiae]|nr:hypothetical protein ColTof3_03383 [Colletotrichum tofieldiae]GKT79124.1 hypothetical protein ColTof4_11547 [Colletotrichum tofieldiae]